MLDLNDLYDDQFLIRMGKEASKFSRLVDKTVGLMIIIDAFTLFILSGQAMGVKIWGNEIASFPGVIEIGILLGSLTYLSNVIGFINLETYKTIMRVILEKRHPKVTPEFYMGSLLASSYVWDLLKPKLYGLKSGRWQIVVAVTLTALILSIALGLYVFHAIAVYLGSVHILQLEAFGPLTSCLIVGALLLINVSGLLLFCIGFLYPFKFQAILKD